MVPRLSNPGRSFTGAGLYYLHDKDTQETSERVQWTATRNIGTDDPEKAVNWMAYTAMAANEEKERSGQRGRKIEKPVWTFSLALAPAQGDPGKDYLMRAVDSFLVEFGLQEHQAVIAAHNDEDHTHAHVMVNRVHPVTGRVNKAAGSNAHLKASKWAQKWEEEEGQIQCQQRIENNAKRAQGQAVKYKDPQHSQKALITRLYHGAKNGRAFQASLAEHGFKIAQGRKVVIIDEGGKQYSILRQLENVKAAALRAKLADIELETISDTRTRQQEETRAAAAGKQTRRQGQGGRTRERAPAAVIDRTDDAPSEETEKLNRTQDRQIDLMGQFYSAAAYAREQLRASLEATYGENERKLRQELAALKSEIQNAGLLRRAAWTLTGQLARKQEEIEEKTKSLQNIEWRKKERTDAVEKLIEARRKEITKRHQQTRQAIREEYQPEPEKKAGRREKPQPTTERERLTERQRQARQERPQAQEPEPQKTAPQPTKQPPTPRQQEFEKATDIPDRATRRAQFMKRMQRQKERSRDRDRGPEHEL